MESNGEVLVFIEGVFLIDVEVFKLIEKVEDLKFVDEDKLMENVFVYVFEVVVKLVEEVFIFVVFLFFVVDMNIILEYCFKCVKCDVEVGFECFIFVECVEIDCIVMIIFWII